jgi:hypothetical protein
MTALPAHINGWHRHYRQGNPQRNPHHTIITIQLHLSTSDNEKLAVESLQTKHLLTIIKDRWVAKAKHRP